MAKGRNKNKDREGSASVVGGSSRPKTSRKTDYDDSDCESISTHITLDDDMRSVQGTDETEEIIGAGLVDSLCEHMDNATHKNISIRLAALRNLYLILASNYLGSELIKYKVTLADLATKAIKKTDEECIVGSQLLAVLSVQLGEELSSEVPEALLLLCPIMTDCARILGVRSAAALSIGITAYFACETEDVFASCFKALSDTWGAFKVGTQYTSLFCSSIGAWCLALEKADNQQLTAAIALQPKLVAFVEGNQLEMRVSAGEALAFLYEVVGEKRSSYKFPNHEHLAHILGELASESSKGKTKKDKRVQKMTFRQIYSFVTEGEAPSLTIKLDKENLELDSCTYKMVYDQLTELLRGGMRRQLKKNELLREFFDLGAPVEETDERMNKANRMAIQNSINKMRDQQRAKLRDKRSC
ncbi:hypothetical protein PRIPAC_80863 [Pristionchus pacificus]|uniref:Uncharacterized protein n=1 Tax=Pristionchus pacificus TaxID=54126 RepID=A0A2A6BEA4_PRIPA|nr:hypothetical protein PRIPAC_80863 [Pristionchus pacificus]|eukprot:PDM64204.1 hypothetical protein PRIPAC_54448 [Pristionchus pacificus]